MRTRLPPAVSSNASGGCRRWEWPLLGLFGQPLDWAVIEIFCVRRQCHLPLTFMEGRFVVSHKIGPTQQDDWETRIEESSNLDLPALEKHLYSRQVEVPEVITASSAAHDWATVRIRESELLKQLIGKRGVVGASVDQACHAPGEQIATGLENLNPDKRLKITAVRRPVRVYARLG